MIRFKILSNTCLSLIGRKSTTYLQKLLFFSSHQFLGRLYTAGLHFSMRLACKIKTSTQTKKKKKKFRISLFLSLLPTFCFSFFKLSPVARLFSSCPCHHHVSASHSFPTRRSSDLEKVYKERPIFKNNTTHLKKSPCQQNEKRNCQSRASNQL